MARHCQTKVVEASVHEGAAPRVSVSASVDKMMRCLSVAVIAAVCPLLLFTQVLAQEPDIDMMLGTRGSCDELILAGKKESCTRGGGVGYTHLRNGAALITVGTADGRAVAFVGEKDSQPQLQVYWLYRSRVGIVSRGSHHIVNVAGQCTIRMARDGTVWLQIDCDGTDENSASYRLHFCSDGRPAKVQIGSLRPQHL